jgi:hypothetical protein
VAVKGLTSAFFVCVASKGLSRFWEEIGVRLEVLSEGRLAVNIGHFSIKAIRSQEKSARSILELQKTQREDKR